MEKILLINDASGDPRIVGMAERRWAEARNLPHATVLLLALGAKGRILLQIRPPGRSYAGCRDIFGGHINIADCISSLDDGIDLNKVAAAAAAREATEELGLTDSTGTPVLLRGADMSRIAGWFPYESKSNTEVSAVFIVPLHRQHMPHPTEDVQDTTVALQTEWSTLRQLKERSSGIPQDPKADYEKNYQGMFVADGLGRLLANNVFNCICAALDQFIAQTRGADHEQ